MRYTFCVCVFLAAKHVRSISRVCDGRKPCKPRQYRVLAKGLGHVFYHEDKTNS